MRVDKYVHRAFWLTVVVSIATLGSRALADDEKGVSPAESKQATQAEASAEQSNQAQKTKGRLTILDGRSADSAAKNPRTVNVEEDVVTTDDGQEQITRVLRINAEPAGDVVAVQLAGEPQSEELGKHWIGVQINEVSPALRAQLNLEKSKGVLVGEVFPDSPASKAGVKQYDILLAIGDHQVANNEDVLKAVREADGKEIKLTLLRGGSERTVNVTPAERSQLDIVARAPMKAGDFANWIQRVQPNARLNLLQANPDNNPQFNVVRPGAALVLRNDALAMIDASQLPDGLSITITREGKQPARIKIKQKEREIETTEDKLTELPEDLRRYVEPMVAHPHAALNLRSRRMLASPKPVGSLKLDMKPDAGGDVLILAPPGQEGAEKRVRRLPPGGPSQGVEQRLERIEQRLEELQRAVGGGKQADNK